MTRGILDGCSVHSGAKCSNSGPRIVRKILEQVATRTSAAGFCYARYFSPSRSHKLAALKSPYVVLYHSLVHPLNPLHVRSFKLLIRPPARSRPRFEMMMNCPPAARQAPNLTAAAAAAASTRLIRRHRGSLLWLSLQRRRPRYTTRSSQQEVYRKFMHLVHIIISPYYSRCVSLPPTPP